MIKLYGYSDPNYPNNLKIRVALTEAGAEYEFVPVDMAKGEHKTPEFLAMNPHGKVPVLTDGNVKLAETNAILWYIAENAEEPLLPDFYEDDVDDLSIRMQRAQVIQFLDMVSMHIYGPQYDYYLHTQGNEPDKRSPEAAEKAKSSIDRALAVIELTLAEREYLAGVYSIADISAAATLRGMKARFPAYATLGTSTEAWLARVTARPAWAKALG